MSSVITERSEKRSLPPCRGWVLYDAACQFCTRWAQWSARILGRRGFSIAPLQLPWVRERLRLPEAELLAEMRVLTVEGKVFGGADALVFLARQIWWAWPLWLAAQLPGMRLLLRVGYRHVADARSCRVQGCAHAATPRKGGL